MTMGSSRKSRRAWFRCCRGIRLCRRCQSRTPRRITSEQAPPQRKPPLTKRARHERLARFVFPRPLPRLHHFAQCNDLKVFELVFGHAEVVAELVEDGEADFLADFLFGFADGLDVLLVEDDVIGPGRHVPDAFLGRRDAVELAHQQVFLRIRLLAGREVLYYHRHVSDFPAELRRQCVQSFLNQPIETRAVHVTSLWPRWPGLPCTSYLQIASTGTSIGNLLPNGWVGRCSQFFKHEVL